MIVNPTKDDTLKAARRLVVQAVASSYVTRLRFDGPEDYKAVCIAVGITPAALREAIEASRSMHAGNRTANMTKREQMVFRVSRLRAEAIKDYCAGRGWSVDGFLRTVVFQYLNSTTEPKHLWEGYSYKAQDVTDPNKATFLEFNLTHAMKQALRVRAKANGATAAGAVRGLALDVVEGRSPPPITLISTKAVSEHVGAFFVPEKFFTVVERKAGQHG